MKTEERGKGSCRMETRIAAEINRHGQLRWQEASSHVAFQVANCLPTINLMISRSTFASYVVENGDGSCPNHHPQPTLHTQIAVDRSQDTLSTWCDGAGKCPKKALPTSHAKCPSIHPAVPLSRPPEWFPLKLVQPVAEAFVLAQRIVHGLLLRALQDQPRSHVLNRIWVARR
jgi:hypothetical protein